MSAIRLRTIALISIILMISLNLFSQNGKLIFTEVCLCERKPELSWIEIMNPMDSPQVLEKIRFSHIRTDNILPIEIQAKGGIEIQPGEVIILSACKEKFIQRWGIDEALVFEIDAIKYFDTGGFIAIKTKGKTRNALDAVRYGDPAVTKEYQNLIGNFVIKLTSDDIGNKIKIGTSSRYEGIQDGANPGSIH